MLSAIILAGGSSQRMGFDKLLAPLCGKPVLTHSISVFDRLDFVTDIILVGRAESLSQYEKISQQYGFKKIAAVIPGGLRRQDSVRLGLAELSADA